MKKCLIAFSLALISQLPMAQADEKYSHFPALVSEDMQTALCNIKTYNQTMTALTSQANLTAQDMVKIHELTYTLENAVAYLKGSLEQVAVDLEEVHKASERLDQKTIQASGRKYLTTTSALLKPSQC